MKDPYKVLGIKKTARPKTIKTAYRKLSMIHHPDKGGDPEKFREIKDAFNLLSDPEKRKRWDSTGRSDESPVTPEKVKGAIMHLMTVVVEATVKPGQAPDDPVWDNIKLKILSSLVNDRGAIDRNISEAKRKLHRTEELQKRFKPNKGSDDFVGQALTDQKNRLTKELHTHEDALELSREVERVVRTYGYEVGPGPEGQVSPRPTILRRGSDQFQISWSDR